MPSAERIVKLRATVLAAVIVLCVLPNTTFAQPLEAQCAPDVYETVGRHLKIKGFSLRQVNGTVISAACKAWPYKPGLLVGAFAYDEGVEFQKKLAITVIEKNTKRIVSSYRNVINEDAVTEVDEFSLQLDTARYQLANEMRALGVRFSSSAHGANCGEAYWGNELTLYVPEKEALRPILTLNLYQQRWLKGCPAATSQALWEDATLTVSMANTSTNGFHDIVITAKITVNAEGVPTGKLKDRTEQHTFHYDGTTYQKGRNAPWWLQI